MNDVVSTCQSTWKQLGVPARARADLEFELRTNLDAAACDGVDATTFVGGDPRGLAREWAVARGLVRTRWLVAGPAVASFVAGLTSLTIFSLLFIPPGGLVAAGGTRQVWFFLTPPASWLLIPALAVLGLHLRRAHDELAVRTVIIALATSPITLWISAVAAAGLEGVGGAPAEPLWISLTFALLLGVIRAVIVAADRRTSPTRD
jgi:hypothetical protein